MNKTQLLYLPRFDVFEGDAEVLECRQDVDGSWCLLLDRTVFYPGGGGQPADTGDLVFNHVTMPLRELRMDASGIVGHHVDTVPDTLLAGATVHMRADADMRSKHCRLHSAGHVIDMAVSRLGYGWIATKGAHFPTMSFVEYEAGEALEEGAREALQSQCNALVAAGSTNTISFVDEQGHELANPGLGHLEAERIVSYDGFGIACGGTHVADIAAIGQIVIKKAKRKKGVVKVSYTIDPL